MEVIAGPSTGLRYSVLSTNTSRLPLTLGRVSPSDLILKDSEVSGKHAMVNWNLHVRILLTVLLGHVFVLHLLHCGNCVVFEQLTSVFEMGTGGYG